MYQSSFPRLFLSFSFQDRGFAQQLFEDLTLLGFQSWVSVNELPQDEQFSNESLRLELQRGLQACDAVLVFVTSKSAASSWVRYEIEEANALGLTVVPIIDNLGSFSIPRHLREADPLSFAQGYKTGIRRVIQRIAPSSPLGKGKSIQFALIEASHNYSESDSLAELLAQDYIEESVSGFLLDIRSYIVGESDMRPPVVRQIVEYAQAGAESRGLALSLGNERRSMPSDSDLIISFLPKVHPDYNYGSPSELMFVSSRLPSRHRLTLAIETPAAAAGRCWLALDGKLSTLSVGRSEIDAHLLSKSRSIGNYPLLLEFPWRNPDKEMLQSLNRVRGALGAGPEQSRPDPTLQGIWPRFDALIGYLLDNSWTMPVLDQPSMFLTHLTHGGVLYWDQSRVNIPADLSRQMIDLVTAAKGSVTQLPSSDGTLCVAHSDPTLFKRF